MTPTNCVLCGRATDKVSVLSNADQVTCALCGTYEISGTLMAILGNDPALAALRPALSAHARQASERRQPVRLDEHNFKDLAGAHLSIPLHQKATRLLEVLASRTKYPGHWCEFELYEEHPLIDAADVEEARFILDFLEERSFVSTSGEAGTRIGLKITFAGWKELGPREGGVPGRCFVAMSFDPALDDAFEHGIKLAVEDCGFTARRVDRDPHYGELIDNRIIAELRAAQFVVADFTQHKPGVYFEAGFALALGRTVIWTCHEDDFANAHFDTNHYPHLRWSDPAGLRQMLADSIRANIARARVR